MAEYFIDEDHPGSSTPVSVVYVKGEDEAALIRF